MKILQMIRDLEITASGGFAIYVLMCVAYVTIMGLYMIGTHIIKWIQNII